MHNPPLVNIFIPIEFCVENKGGGRILLFQNQTIINLFQVKEVKGKCSKITNKIKLKRFRTD